MKKIIVFSLLIFTSISVFAYDYREIIFGNNYENIKECTDDEIIRLLIKHTRLNIQFKMLLTAIR
ncbi:hypothetical protein [Treponema pedis]